MTENGYVVMRDHDARVMRVEIPFELAIADEGVDVDVQSSLALVHLDAPTNHRFDTDDSRST